MKKIMTILTVLMCFVSTSAFAQEIRGIETRRVVYKGERIYNYENGTYYYSFPNYDKSSEYYGWEFKNLNSCAASVDISLFEQAKEKNGSYIPAKVIATKTIILQPKEFYIFKHEIKETQKLNIHGDINHDVDNYYVEYKAFKLQ